MKQIAGVFALMLASTVLAAPRQAPADPASQPSSHGAGSTSNKATSHDRHARKHHTGSHHHRHRTTAKSHSS